MMNRLVAVVGPTAIGKSRVALRLAQEFNGEIVGADSRQVYRYMDIGTAKPSQQEMSLVPHHLINVVDPDDDFSLAQYQQLACKAIDDTQQRGKLPLLVGGSGQYVWAILEGWKIPKVLPDLDFRHGLEERAARGEADGLYQKLVKVDPVAAQKIDRYNVRRVIRALEVCKGGGTPFSQLQQKEMPSYDILIMGLTADRVELYRRIDSRVDEMIAQGLIKEVKELMNMGYGFDLPAMSGVGYRQIGQFSAGEIALADATQQIKFETHRIARHQYSWFRLKDERIHWFDIKDEVEPKISAVVGGFIGN